MSYDLGIAASNKNNSAMSLLATAPAQIGLEKEKKTVVEEVVVCVIEMRALKSTWTSC